MYPSNGLGGDSRNSAGHPAGSEDYNASHGLNGRSRTFVRYPYSNIVPARPAPPPPTSGLSGLSRRTTTSGAHGSSSARLSGRRGSLATTHSSNVSGLSATRPLGFQSGLEVPPLEALMPSTRRSGSRGLTSPRLGSGQSYRGTETTGGMSEGGTSLLSRSQPIDILSPLGINDWRNSISSGPPLENPTLRETRREARHRTRDDWEIDGELHPYASLDSDLEDSTDGETDSPASSQGGRSRQRANSLRRTPELENLRSSNDSGIAMNTSRNFGSSSRSADDFGLSGLNMSAGSGLTAHEGGRTYIAPGYALNGHRDRRNALSSGASSPLASLPELDLGPGAMQPLRRSRYLPPGPAPTAPLPRLPNQGGLAGLGGLGSLGGVGGPPALSRRRSSLQEPYVDLRGYTDPFASPPHVPGQHRIREHMLEFTDGDYIVRIRNNQLARQQQQEEQRNRSSNNDGDGSLMEARRLGL